MFERKYNNYSIVGAEAVGVVYRDTPFTQTGFVSALQRSIVF